MKVALSGGLVFMRGSGFHTAHVLANHVFFRERQGILLSQPLGQLGQLLGGMVAGHDGANPISVGLFVRRWEKLPSSLTTPRPRNPTWAKT